MPEHDLEKLLGGFAADTLTTEETQQLYTAALQDQNLFNALADEQALKELLSDPAARRRLLQSLQTTNSATAGGSRSWFDWFSRPAGPAWAGGFAAAVLAVFLGTRIYKDSMKEAGRSVATEETSPAAPAASAPPVTKSAAPPINESRLNTPDNTKPAVPPMNETPTNKTAKRETTAPAKPEERRARDSSRNSPLQQYEEAGLQRQAEATSDKLVGSKEEPSASVDQRSAGTPSAPASVLAPTRFPASAGMTDQPSSTRSARTLFYGGTEESDVGSLAEEKEGSQSTQQFGRIEKKQNQLAVRKTEKVAASTKPLGIRYSLPASKRERMRSDIHDGPTNPAGSIDLTIEANQDGYLQVWGETESLQHHLLLPIPEQEPLSSKLIARQRRTIPISAGYGTIMLRFSRVPFVPSTEQAPTLSDRSSVGQLQESATADEASGFQEHITYVVNQDLSLPELLVTIPVSRP